MSIFNSLSKLITPELISTASKALGEDSSKVSSALTSIVPGLLSSFLQKGNSSDLMSILTKAAGAGDILGNVTSLFGGGASKGASSIGDGFLKAILGNKLSSFTSGIAQDSGLSVGNAGKLLSSVAPLVAGTLGSKMLTGGLDMNGLLKSVDKEKDNFMSLVPKGINKLVCDKDYATSSHATTPKGDGGNKWGNSWWKWLLGLLLLAVLCFFLFKNCKSCAPKATVEAPIVAIADVDANANVKKIHESCMCVDCKCVECPGMCGQIPVTVVKGAEKTTIRKVVKPTVKITMPECKPLVAFDNGAETKVITYLASPEYDKATVDNKDVDDSWFTFDNVDFEEGTDVLVPESNTQLENIAEILKRHPHSKIKINAHTDKAGNNDKVDLTNRRADQIKIKLVHAGLDAEKIDAKGLADELAGEDAGSHVTKRVNDRRVTFTVRK